MCREKYDEEIFKRTGNYPLSSPCPLSSHISGLKTNEKVDFYGVDGKILGSATAINGSVSFSAQQGTIIIAKIGKESVKITVE